MRFASLSLLALPTLVLPTLACPAQVPGPQQQEVVHTSAGDPTPANVPITPADDPRLVRDTDDLYDGENPSPVAPDDDALGPGSGAPDETNGECRLFAPKLPQPHCCPFEVGFDAEAIRQLCGHAVYLGESLQHSCGYYFTSSDPGATPVFMRGSKLMVTSVPDAAKQHDERLRMALDKPEFGSTPVPGLEGAMWSAAEGLHWAFLPGWDNVRLISWNDGACSDEVMPQVLKRIAEAVPPPPNAPREGMLPTARKPKPPASPEPAK